MGMGHWVTDATATIRCNDPSAMTQLDCMVVYVPMYSGVVFYLLVCFVDWLFYSPKLSGEFGGKGG